MPTPAATIEDVLKRLEAIEAALTHRDGRHSRRCLDPAKVLWSLRELPPLRRWADKPIQKVFLLDEFDFSTLFQILEFGST